MKTLIRLIRRGLFGAPVSLAWMRAGMWRAVMIAIIHISLDFGKDLVLGVSNLAWVHIHRIFRALLLGCLVVLTLALAYHLGEILHEYAGMHRGLAHSLSLALHGVVTYLHDWPEE